MKKWRKWIDLLLFYFSLILVISGVVLYIMPHGRVAYFTGWTLWGLDKDQWDGLHIISGFVIGVVAVIHTIINWKPLKNYLFKRESLIALGITGVVIAGTITNLPPFKWVFQLEERIKNSWEVNRYQIPIAHGELLSLKEFCKRVGIPLSVGEKALKEKGIKFQPDWSLKKIGKENNLSPAQIYQILKEGYNSSTSTGKSSTPVSSSPSAPATQPLLSPGSGIGFLTIPQFCEKFHCDPQRTLNFLAGKGEKGWKLTPQPR